MENDRKSIGAFWLKTAKSGTKYMSGSIEIEGEKHDIVVFKNDYKTEERHPDYKIYLNEKRRQDAPPILPANTCDDVSDGEIPF